jgi:hypothetical protein
MNQLVRDFLRKTSNLKIFSIEESMDTKIKTENGTEQNIPTTSESMEEVNSILYLLFFTVTLFFEG